MDNQVNTNLNSKQKSPASRDSKKIYEVNDSAETTLNVISTIIIFIGIIASPIIILVGFAMESSYDDSKYTIILSGFATLISSVLFWAISQVFINISKSLKNINNQLNRFNEKK